MYLLIKPCGVSLSRRVTGVALVLFLVSACSVAPKVPSTQSLLADDYSLVIEYLQEFIPAQMKKTDITGLSVALVDDQRLVWSEGFGFADKSAQVSATNTTGYQAGSVSKLFTAMAAMKLQQDGKLDLDAPISDYIPEFNLKTRFGSIEGITIRNTLTHHAGIPSNIIDGMWANNPDSFKTVATRLNRYYAAYPPNTVFAYSNAGYSLAGHAVENASGTPFSQFVNEALLEPLEMVSSNMNFDFSGEQVSRSYWHGKESAEVGLRDLPAGGLVTTVDDLSKLVKLVNGDGFYQSQIFTSQTMQEMLAIQAYDSIYEPSGFNGIGWFNFSEYLDGKYKAVGHFGQTMAHSAAVVVVPEIKLGVVVLANTPSLQGELTKIVDQTLRLAHTVKTRTDLSDVEVKDTTPVTLPGEAASFNGQFSSTFGYLDIDGDDKRYGFTLDGQKMALSREQDGGYSLTAKVLGFFHFKPPGLGELSFFPRDVSGKRIVYLRTASGQYSVVATEVVKQERLAAWDAMLGKYTVANPMEIDNDVFKIDRVELVYEQGAYHAIVKTPMQGSKIPLNVVNNNEAILQGYGRGLGETLFGQDDGSVLFAGLIFKPE